MPSLPRPCVQVRDVLPGALRVTLAGALEEVHLLVYVGKQINYLKAINRPLKKMLNLAVGEKFTLGATWVYESTFSTVDVMKSKYRSSFRMKT